MNGAAAAWAHYYYAPPRHPIVCIVPRCDLAGLLYRLHCLERYQSNCVLWGFVRGRRSLMVAST